MVDWLAPQHLLLVAVPIAMVLAALALAAGQRRAEARRSRDSLGRPDHDVDAVAEGERVLLEGNLDVVDAPCARFEDGAPCAAATVESNGPRAAHEDPSAVASPAAATATATATATAVVHSTRAAVLVLSVGAERVLVSGPVDVFVGSRETDPRAPFEDLGPGVRDRIATAAEVGHAPVRARPVFRSLASGDRVRAAGLLVKQSEGDRTGYRERARWALQGDGARPVVLAYAGTPRHRGPLASVLRGVRRIPAARAALAVSLLLGLVTGVAAASRREAPTPPAPAPVHMMASHFADATRCAALKKEHAALVRGAGACVADTDCAAQLRGGAYFGLEGCHRYLNRHRSSGKIEAVEKAWLDEGCATSYEICPPPSAAMCRESQCVERPPPSVPETWHREDVPGGFFMYLPADVTGAATRTDDELAASYRGDGIHIVTDFAEQGPVLSEEAGKGTPVKVGGRHARVWRSESEITLTFEDDTVCQPPRCSHFVQGEKLTLHADCQGEAACDRAWLAFQSVRFW